MADVLSPKAGELIAYLEHTIAECGEFLDPGHPDTVESIAKMREAITLLRERDELARVICEHELAGGWWHVVTVVGNARAAIGRLHAADIA